MTFFGLLCLAFESHFWVLLSFFVELPFWATNGFCLKYLIRLFLFIRIILSFNFIHSHSHVKIQSSIYFELNRLDTIHTFSIAYDN